ncbi:MAG TPA: hypothetical protein VHA06_04520, partial [Candidatus Angelobacter sp.]|nr:hypothetical protein [Candidatus Angelobacter sp.]
LLNSFSTISFEIAGGTHFLHNSKAVIALAIFSTFRSCHLPLGQIAVFIRSAQNAYQNVLVNVGMTFGH